MVAKAPKEAGPSLKQERARKRTARPEGQESEHQNADPGPDAQLYPEQEQQDASPLVADLSSHASADVLDQLWARIESRKDADLEISCAARLLARGTAHVAQKLGEEAVACVIEGVAGSREGLIGKSADVLYHLLALWVSAGVRPEDVWHELHRRERVSRLREGVGRKRAIKRVIGRAGAKVRTTKIP